MSSEPPGLAAASWTTASVRVGVGYHSGSHYSAIQALEPFLERSEIALEFVGLPFDRIRLMHQGRVEAANVSGAQYYLLEQLGFRKLVDTTFIMGSLVSEDTDREDLERYFKGLRRAQREIDLEAERYKHHWLRDNDAILDKCRVAWNWRAVA